MLSAPRINMGRAQPQASGETQSGSVGQVVAAPTTAVPEHIAQLQAQVLKHVREIVRNSENVGDQFAQEARRMHEGESEHRAIRGSTTLREREDLARDGIAVLPIPDYLDDDRLQ